MHDCYQQRNPLNEAPLNGNTIIPPGAQEERQDCFFFFFVPSLHCNKCSMGSISATKCMKVKVQSATRNGHVEDEVGTGGVAFEGVFFYGLVETERIICTRVHAHTCD